MGTLRIAQCAGSFDDDWLAISRRSPSTASAEGASSEATGTVHASKAHKPPRTAYVAVKYRGYWFYIDDRDAASKATLALMMQLARLDFTRQQPGAPQLTLPVGR